jgi:hypothetical protein
MKDGRYAHRFSGVALRNMLPRGMPHHLVGAGTFVIQGKKVVDGEQSSSIVPLNHSAAAVKNARFRFAGDITGPVNGIYHAALSMVKVMPEDSPQDLTAEFDFVAAADGRLWLISTYAFNNTSGSVAEELVSGEAVWTGDYVATAKSKADARVRPRR